MLLWGENRTDTTVNDHDVKRKGGRISVQFIKPSAEFFVWRYKTEQLFCLVSEITDGIADNILFSRYLIKHLLTGAGMLR